MPFTDGVQLRYVGLGWYESTAPCVYVGKSDVITIPAGTRSDLASTPRWTWWALPATGAYERAAFVHDEGCTECNRAYKEGRPPAMPPRDVDGLFARILREEHEHALAVGDLSGLIPRWKRTVLWIGVRWGALFNPARRAGWARDAPYVVGLSLAALIALLAAVWAADRFAHWTLHELAGLWDTRPWR